MQTGLKKTLAMIWLLGSFLVIGWSTPSYAAETEEQTCAEVPLLQVAAADSGMSSTGDTVPPSGDVQERAVPRMGPGGMAPPAGRQDVGGGIIEGNRLTAKPGYVVEVMPNNQAMLKPAGGGTGIKVTCQCSKGMGGGCKLVGGSGNAYCEAGGFSKCQGTCKMVDALKAANQGLTIQ